MSDKLSKKPNEIGDIIIEVLLAAAIAACSGILWGMKSGNKKPPETLPGNDEIDSAGDAAH